MPTLLPLPTHWRIGLVMVPARRYLKKKNSEFAIASCLNTVFISGYLLDRVQLDR